jgi:hypothetical protein
LLVSLGLGALATVFGLSGGVTTRSILTALSSGLDLMTANIVAKHIVLDELHLTVRIPSNLPQT